MRDLLSGVVAVVVGACVFPPGPVVAQEGPSHVYEAYYKVNMADLGEWNRIYWEHSVPVLNEMQESGAIEGFSQWEHHTGGDYNIRFTVRTFDWAGLGSFWSEYLSAMQARMSPDEWVTMGSIIQAHYDEIWDIAEINVPGAGPFNYMYAATFQYNFGMEPEWNEVVGEVMAPGLNDAMEAGLLNGWVRLTHNTGGAHNSKFLYLFEDWDSIDDMVEMVWYGMIENSPEAFDRFARFAQSHDDIIWVPTPQPGM